MSRSPTGIYGTRLAVSSTPLASTGAMWGTDWTRAVKLLTYAEGLDAFRLADRLSDSDRAKLMGGTASRVYNWSPSKA
jgi:hypothetical protein